MKHNSGEHREKSNSVRLVDGAGAVTDRESKGNLDSLFKVQFLSRGCLHLFKD